MSSFFESLSKAVSSPSPTRSTRSNARTPGQSATPNTTGLRTPASASASRVSGTPRTPILSPVATEAEREQALRDYKVTIEYKHLKNHAPGGVYLIPSLDDLRHFHGVIFIRRGPYTNGIFKFQLRLPQKYNDVDEWPRITFSGCRVYNPHVNAETGELDLESAYPTWDPHRHYLVTVLTYLKKIFYMKTFPSGSVANPEARDLATSDQATYRRNVDACVRDSQKSVFVNADPGCTAKFTEDELCHAILRDLMKTKLKDPATMTRAQVLEMVQQAGKEAAAREQEGGGGGGAGSSMQQAVEG